MCFYIYAEQIAYKRIWNILLVYSMMTLNIVIKCHHFNMEQCIPHSLTYMRFVQHQFRNIYKIHTLNKNFFDAWKYYVVFSLEPPWLFLNNPTYIIGFDYITDGISIFLITVIKLLIKRFITLSRTGAYKRRNGIHFP